MTNQSRAARATTMSCGLLAAWLAASGCGEDGAHSGEPMGPDEGPGGSGGEEEMPPRTGTNGAPVVGPPPLHAAANDMRSRAPMDAMPSADGERVFYTALGTDAEGALAPGVFATDAAGGGEI